MNIRIGLIDSGININSPLIIRKNYIFNGWKDSLGDFNDSLGHGTVCAHLIQKAAENADIYNVKVFDKKLVTSTKNIIEAVNWCMNNNINLINLSLSVSDINYYYEFKQICEEAYKRGIIIIASADNIGRPCLPAYLENVIGVGVADLQNESEFFYVNSFIQIYLNGKSITGSFNQEIQATSFATARMSGIIANILIEKPELDFNHLKHILLSKSIPFKKEKILVKNQTINLNKNIIPISLNKRNNVKSIVKELKTISNQHIVNSQKQIIVLTNLTEHGNIFNIELKIRAELIKRNYKIGQLSANIRAEEFGFDYSFSSYKQLPEKFHSAYAKALIESVNHKNPKAKSIIIGMDKPIIPLSINNSNFFDIYSIPEISLLFGFQVDFCILIINELTEYEYIKKNIICLESLFNIQVLFLIYNSLYNENIKNKTVQELPNIKQIKKISAKRFIQLQDEIKTNLNLNVYDINDEINNAIYDEICNVL
jgi:hypothetical protein